MTLSGQSYSLDNEEPTLSSKNRLASSGQLSKASSVTFQATFSKVVTGVAASNFTLSGTAMINNSNIGTPATTDGGQHWSRSEERRAGKEGTPRRAPDH